VPVEFEAHLAVLSVAAAAAGGVGAAHQCEVEVAVAAVLVEPLPKKKAGGTSAEVRLTSAVASVAAHLRSGRG